MPATEKKLFLLDAYALIYRAYYAFIKNPRINSKGLNTSAILGFTNYAQVGRLLQDAACSFTHHGMVVCQYNPYSFHNHP